MLLVGLDYSLNATGAFKIDTESGRTWSELIEPKTRYGHIRLDYNLAQVALFCQDATAANVEGPSYSSASSSSHQLAGHWWLQTQQLHRRRIPYAKTSPSTLKQYVTGNGVASKLDMLSRLRADFPHVEIKDDNVADALALALMLCRWKGQVVDGHTHRRLDAMDDVAWPDPVSGEPVSMPRKQKHKPIRG